MKIINRSDCPKKLVKMEGSFGVDMQVPLGVDDGVPTCSMRILTVIPGGNTPWHDHPFEHMNYVISGEGILNMKDGPYHLKQGDCIYVPSGWIHNYENISGRDGEYFVFICMVPKEFECGCPDERSDSPGSIGDEHDKDNSINED